MLTQDDSTQIVNNVAMCGRSPPAHAASACGAYGRELDVVIIRSAAKLLRFFEVLFLLFMLQNQNSRGVAEHAPSCNNDTL